MAGPVRGVTSSFVRIAKIIFWVAPNFSRARLDRGRKSPTLGQANPFALIPGPVVSNLVRLFLAAILLACPAMCRATSDDCCRGAEPGDCHEDPGHPAPVDDDGCICSGATLAKADDTRAGKLFPVLDVPAAFPIDTALGLSPPLLARGPSAPPANGRPSAVRLHALLEIHRC